MDNSQVIENVHSFKTVASFYIVYYHLSDSAIIRVDTLLNLALFTYFYNGETITKSGELTLCSERPFTNWYSIQQ